MYQTNPRPRPHDTSFTQSGMRSPRISLPLFPRRNRDSLPTQNLITLQKSTCPLKRSESNGRRQRKRTASGTSYHKNTPHSGWYRRMTSSSKNVSAVNWIYIWLLASNARNSRLTPTVSSRSYRAQVASNPSRFTDLCMSRMRRHVCEALA